MNDFFCLKPSLILFITIFIYFINYYAKDIKKKLVNKNFIDDFYIFSD